MNKTPKELVEESEDGLAVEHTMDEEPKPKDSKVSLEEEGDPDPDRGPSPEEQISELQDQLLHTV